YAETLVSKRLKAVAAGEDAGGITTSVNWQGGAGYSFCTLGETLFDENGAIRDRVSFADLAQHVYFAETGVPLPRRARGRSPLLGVHDDQAVYLLYNGVLGDRRPEGGNVLTSAVLAALPPHDGPKVIYGESCRLGLTRLQREKIVFKQTPYDVRVVG
ncbi:MAG: site-specific DNA-methyltransferase, partial [Gemmatimonadaceae bacterium]|nr:site-specific DNA-methyltransferase [Gemmatimonadaceae bacterium]